MVPLVNPSTLPLPIKVTALPTSSEVIDKATAFPLHAFDDADVASVPEETQEMALLPTMETLSLGTTDNTTSADIDQLQQGHGDFEGAEGEPAPIEMSTDKGKVEKKR